MAPHLLPLLLLTLFVLASASSPSAPADEGEYMLFFESLFQSSDSYLIALHVSVSYISLVIIYTVSD